MLETVITTGTLCLVFGFIVGVVVTVGFVRWIEGDEKDKK